MDLEIIKKMGECEQLVGEERVQKMGNRIAFSDVEVKDEKGETVAIARCTIMVVEEKEGNEKAEDRGESSR